MSAHPANRRLAKAIAAKNDPAQTFGYMNCAISAVTPGASRDGTYQVSILFNSYSVESPYLAALTNGYTPVVGDMVAVIFIDGAPLILDRVRGLPTF